MSKLFGTDGIRGVVNKILTPELSFKCGRAVGILQPNSKVIIAKDTRISGDMLMCAFVSGLVSQGIDVDILGLSSTPALAFLTKDRYDFGIMLTASHNPYFYNGIKIFDKTGNKLNKLQEEKIENLILNIEKYEYMTCDNLGEITYKEELLDLYIEFLKNKLTNTFYDLKVCIDTANGGAVEIAKRIFNNKNFKKLSFINDKINGKEINNNCGATNLEMLKNYVKDKGFDIGFAFDGDADRIMIVDKYGNIFDGDDIVFLLLNSNIEIHNNTVVGTVMTNFGLENFLISKGLKLIRVAVGDKNIKECMIKNGFTLGGESSGHIITNETCTGDAVYVAIQVLNILNDKKCEISHLLKEFKKYPNKIVNLNIDEGIKGIFVESSFLKNIIDKYQKVLNKDGRILVRASGTEPLIRVLVEGKSLKDIEFVTNGLSAEIQKYLEKIVWNYV